MAMRYARGWRRSAAVGLALVAMASVGVAAHAAAADNGEAAIKRYQKTVLDPQAETGLKPRPTAPDPYMQHMTGMKHDMAGMAGMKDMAAVAGPLAPNVGGQWGYLPGFDPKFNAIHEVSSPTGKILLIAGSGNNQANFAAGTFRSYIWDTRTGARRMVATPKDLFCGGHVLLSDGRALVTGGTASYVPFKGTRTMYAFNFVTEKYERLPDMWVGRWYPSNVTGPDGRVLIVSGLDQNGKVTGIVEVFDPRTNKVTKLPGAHTFSLYPHIFLLANGKYFWVGSGGSQAGVWQPFNGNAFQPVTGLAVPKQRTADTACWVNDVRDQNLIVAGGGWPATTSTNIINPNAAKPVYRAGPPLRAAKAYLGCVNLPNGSLFEANGGSANTVAGASTEASFLNSIAGPWVGANPLPNGEHRVYHSMLFLLDDGRVMSISSNPQGGPVSTSVLVYSPPYLFKGPKPVFTTVPNTVTYGGTYAVAATTSGGAKFTRVAIISASSTTHATAPNQRYMSVPLVNGKILMPTNRAILPPGWWRLWALDSMGRVSNAHWVHLG